jgi:hypothetical protein
MPKLLCHCGFSINLSSIPNPHEFQLIASEQTDAMYDALTQAWSDAETSESFGRRAAAVFSTGLQPRLVLYECPNCGRIAIEVDGSIIAWYTREQSGSSPISLASVVASAK